MPLPKIKASSATDVMKSTDGNDSLDTFIRQAIGKEPFLTFSKANDSPVQWIQLLHALDQQDVPGWPLLSPVKVQMQKCDKCSQEFCSTINYRRHMRLHRRNLNLDKESTTKNRGLLQAFWDKLSMEEAMEIMSFNDVSLEGVTGSSIMKALTSLVRKPGFSSLPQRHIKAGSILLDIVQCRPSRFPISSQELFGILDDASEKTFLYAGTAESLQKYVFDGEAGKIGLEMRNLIACTSFIIEQKLVKACLADKDAEALRYQKLLVEEEEAAQKRQAALLEKRRQKKLRQKEQKAKEQASLYDSPIDSFPSSPTSSSPVDSPHNPSPSPEHVQIVIVEGDIDKDHENGYTDLGPYQNVDHRTFRQNGRRHLSNSRWPSPKLRIIPNDFHASRKYQPPRPRVLQKRAPYRDSRSPNAANGGKVWTPKSKSDIDDEIYKTSLTKEDEVLIGSIPVTLGNHSSGQQDENEKPVNRSTVKLWRPVSRQENGGHLQVRSTSDGSEVGVVLCNDGGEVHQICPVEVNSNGYEKNPDSSVKDGHQGDLVFSSHVAEAFLSKRWKEAICSDHVKLVLFPEAKPPGCSEVQDDNQEAVPMTNSDNRYASLESSAAMRWKITGKPEKGSMVKYIPKQRSKS